ncbi:MAG TPA: hypothetical protein VGC85_09615, partial [Chthoniobacterales bacterium]
RHALAGSCVRHIHGAGLLLGLRVPSAVALKKHLESEHILVGGSSDPGVVRLMPPLNVSDEAIDALAQSIHTFV